MSFPRYPKYKDSGVEWMGDVPEHWEVVRLKHAAQGFPSNVDKKSYDGETPVRLCNYTDVYYNETISPAIDFMPATATSDQIAKFTLRAGDTIITKDSETADDIAVAAYVPADLPAVVCGYHLSIIRPMAGYSGAFIKRLFDSAYVKATVAVLANGLTRVGLGQHDLDNIELPFPPRAEQCLLVRFLDRETAKIDALVDEQRRLIELLKEKRQALISHAVSKGLNPDVPMKGSGHRWLGDVPAHWDMKRLKDVVRPTAGIQMGPFGGMLKELSIEPTGAKLYGQVNTISGDFGAGCRWLSKTQFDELREYELLPGDLVLTRKGASIGHCRVAPETIERGVIDSDTIRVRLESRLVLTEFAVLLMHEGYMEQAIIERQKGSVLPGLNTSTIANLPIALPPVAEQRDIMAMLEGGLAELQELIIAVEHASALLHERRIALISAAVTGKIDVRHLAGAEAA